MKNYKTQPAMATTILPKYQHFDGRHRETGTLHNYLAFNDYKAPHTGKPYSEALLLGVSGGITTGYFTFAYKGYDPHVALLTRNTFDPLDRILTRLGIEREFLQTNKPGKAVTNLIDTLEDGVPALVWADFFSLPYNALPHDEGMWGATPILVYGCDESNDLVNVADRSSQPLTMSCKELMTARARIKKEKFRIVRLDIPDPDRVPAAVSAGLWDCIRLFTEKPPRGSAKNFGFAAYQNWIDLLRNRNSRQSWAREFPPGPKMYAGLTSTLDRMGMVGIIEDADRGLFAQFLEEASTILDRPGLKDIASAFRKSSSAWATLRETLLPDSVPQFKETRELIIKRRQIFIHKGMDAVPRMQEIDERLSKLQQALGKQFPLDDAGVETLRNAIADQLQVIHDIEKPAIESMRKLMG